MRGTAVPIPFTLGSQQWIYWEPLGLVSYRVQRVTRETWSCYWIYSCLSVCTQLKQTERKDGGWGTISEPSGSPLPPTLWDWPCDMLWPVGQLKTWYQQKLKKMHVHWGLLSLLLFLGTLWPLLCKQAGISQLWQEIHGQVTSTAQLNLCQLSDTDWGHPPSSIPSQATSWPQGSDEPIQPRTTQSMHKITRRISIHYLNPHTGGGMLH